MKMNTQASEKVEPKATELTELTKAKTIITLWEVRTYDVWGNANDGYEVNDSFVVNRAYEILCDVELNNAGTEMEFESAFPSDEQIKIALGINIRVNLDIDGDDLSIYVAGAQDCYPLGEMFCVSHESLSPIREKKEKGETQNG